MKRHDVLDRISNMLKKAREDANVSQDTLAKRLDISKRTVQNWESGLSAPSLDMGLAWFDALRLQPLQYFLEMLYESNKSSTSTDELDGMIAEFVKGLPKHTKEQLVFLAYGDHGTAPMGFFELQTAYLQTSLRDRVTAAQLIKSNYELSKAFNTVGNPDKVQPDIQMIDEFIDEAKKTIKDKLNKTK